MFVKASALILVLICFLVHACNARRLAATNSISHKIGGGSKRNMNSFSSNDLPSKIAAAANPKETEDVCKKNQGIEGIKTGVTSRSKDCTKLSPHHKSFLQYSTNSEGSRWTHVNVREMDLHNPKEEDFFETDYQPPHRKAPIHN